MKYMVPPLAQIARSLSPSQRAAMLWLPREGSRVREPGAPSRASFFWLAKWRVGDPLVRISLLAHFVEVYPARLAPRGSGRVWLPDEYGLTLLGQQLRDEVVAIEEAGQ